MISVALVEDNRLIREGMVTLLGRATDIKVVLAVSKAEVHRLPMSKPEVILLHGGHVDGDCVGLTRSLRQEVPASRVIIMNLLPTQHNIVDFVGVGVAGLIAADATLQELENTIRLVARGANVLPGEMTTTLFTQVARQLVLGDRAGHPEDNRLTLREREVTHLIAQGLCNKEIAKRLGVATETVKSHVRNVMEKLSVHTRLQIAALAHAHAEWSPGPMSGSSRFGERHAADLADSAPRRTEKSA